jgi:hypothetical protein
MFQFSVDWEDFLEKFYEWLKKPVPTDPTALGDKPTAFQIINATTQQLQRLAKRGVTDAASEIERRNQQAQPATSKSSPDSLIYYPTQVHEDLDDAQRELQCLKVTPPPL